VRGMEEKSDSSRKSRARALRRSATEGEALLWRRLRANQLGVKFRRQHPIGVYVLDFFCHSASLAIEVDGGQHFSNEAAAHDSRRSQFLSEYGIRVLRFTNAEVLSRTDSVLEAILRAVQRRGDA
jgi:very-short-patch-repair endonuclease